MVQVYVDDILCIFPISNNADDFLITLNSKVPSINFTVELEDEQLPFLDVLIHCTDNSLLFSIYRKPTNSLSYVHYYSYHSNSVKSQIFTSMLLRACRLTSSQYLVAELCKISNMGNKMGYPNYFIGQCHRKYNKTFHKGESNCNRNSSERVSNGLCLPYFAPFEK